MVLNEFIKLRFKNVEEPEPFSSKVQEKEGTIKGSFVTRFFKLVDIKIHDVDNILKCYALYRHNISNQIIRIIFYEIEENRKHLFSLYNKDDFMNFALYEVEMPHKVNATEDKEWKYQLLGK